MRESTFDKADYSKLKEEEAEVPEIGNRFGTESFSSIAGRDGALRTNYPIKYFRYPTHEVQQRFYVS